MTMFEIFIPVLCALLINQLIGKYFIRNDNKIKEVTLMISKDQIERMINKNDQ